MLSNTLALELFIMRHGKDKSLAKPAIDIFETFSTNHKIRGGRFRLLSENQLDKGRITELLSGILGREVNTSFVGIAQLREGGRPEQLKLLQMIDDAGPLHRLLPYNEAKARHGSIRTTDKDTLEDLISLSLGTHRLRPIFDETFGHDFSRLIRWNIEVIWYCYCSYILDGDVDKASKFGAASEMLTRAAPVGLLPLSSGRSKSDRPEVCVFIDSNEALDIGKLVSLERKE